MHFLEHCSEGWERSAASTRSGYPLQAYLTSAFERLGTHRDLFDLPLEALTPAAFKKTLG
nr:MAG: hypothetical protein DIU78_09525 [Pseudomonadota bacterium]